MDATEVTLYHLNEVAIVKCIHGIWKMGILIKLCQLYFIFFISLSAIASGEKCIEFGDEELNSKLHGLYSGSTSIKNLKNSNSLIDKTIYGWAAYNGAYGVYQDKQLSNKLLWEAFADGSIVAGYIYTVNNGFEPGAKNIRRKKISDKYSNCKGINFIKIELDMPYLFLVTRKDREYTKSLIDKHINDKTNNYYMAYYYDYYFVSLILDKENSKGRKKSQIRADLLACAKKGYPGCAYTLSLLPKDQSNGILITPSYWKLLSDILGGGAVLDKKSDPLLKNAVNDLYGWYKAGIIENRRIRSAIRYCDMVTSETNNACIAYSMSHHAKCFMVDYSYLGSVLLDAFKGYRECRSNLLKGVQ